MVIALPLAVRVAIVLVVTCAPSKAGARQRGRRTGASRERGGPDADRQLRCRIPVLAATRFCRPPLTQRPPKSAAQTRPLGARPLGAAPARRTASRFAELPLVTEE